LRSHGPLAVGVSWPVTELELAVSSPGPKAYDAGDMKSARFDTPAFYSALDIVRRGRELHWSQVALESGLSASTLTRMSQGKRPDIDGLAALCAWSGLSADKYIRPLVTSAFAEPRAGAALELR